MSQNEIRTAELVRSIRDQIYEQTKNLSPEELQSYIAREAGKLAEELKTHKPDKSAA